LADRSCVQQQWQHNRSIIIRLCDNSISVFTQFAHSLVFLSRAVAKSDTIFVFWQLVCVFYPLGEFFA